MKDIREIHRKAMELMQTAKIALSKGEENEYITLSEAALELEKEAAFDLKYEYSEEPTRSVLFKGAANIAYNLADYEQASKLIHIALSGNPYDEIKAELKTLYDKVNQAQLTAITLSNKLDNAYLDLLREKAVNIKIEDKEHKYSKAILTENIIDILQNVEGSYMNYATVNFIKELDLPKKNRKKTLASIKNNSKTLAVDLAFASFGISIVVDTRIMNTIDQLPYSPELVEFKSNLFENFKEEVLLADYNSPDFIDRIVNKYSEEERIQIYKPILNSLREKSKYNLSIADRDFKHVIKTFDPVTEITETKLIPIPTDSLELTDVFLKRTLEVSGGNSKRSQKILSENLTYVKFTMTFQTLNFQERTIYFIHPYEVEIIFDKGDFKIADQNLDIELSTTEFKEIEKIYSKQLIEKFNFLSSENDLGQNDTLLLERMKLLFIP